MSDLVFNFVCPAGGGDTTGTTYCFDVNAQAKAAAEDAAKPEVELAQPEPDGSEPAPARTPQPTL